MAYDTLLSPIKIGNIEVKNRVAMAPMCTQFVSPGGYVNEQVLAWYAARAKGGTGLIISGGCYATNEGGESSPFRNMRLATWHHIAGMSELAETVHAFGAKIITQLNTGVGRQGYQNVTGVELVAPSAIPFSVQDKYNMKRAIEYCHKKGWISPYEFLTQGSVPRALTIDEIIATEDKFVEAILRAIRCGFDGVEIHSAHGYLSHQFLSPRSNYRTDMYGGSRENRFRFLRNLIRKTRERIGHNLEDFVVGIRISGDEHLEGGFTHEDVKWFCQEAEKEGIDFIHLSDGCYEARNKFLPEEMDGYKCMLSHAESLSKVVKVPIITPSIHDPEVGEAALKDGKASMVSLGRQLIADPEWVNKVSQGKKFVKCIRCGMCLERIIKQLPLRCEVNSNAGNEKYMPEYNRSNAPNKKVWSLGKLGGKF